MNGTPAADDERLARAVLTYLAGPGDPFPGTLARRLGGTGALEAIRAGRLPGLPEPQQHALKQLSARLGQVPGRDEVRRVLDGGHCRLVCPGDPEWPGGLDQLADAQPAALWVTGGASLGAVLRASVTVTGTRAASAYGAWIATDLAAGLAACGLAVVAGGAFGIDAAAHRGALSTGGATIAVLPGGTDVPYPAGHAGLFAEAAVRGALVSEQPPGTPVAGLRFRWRNRITAALSAATVIVEAPLRSGALDSARHARDLRRPVMAVPGPVTSDLSQGCHQLIRDGAVLVTTARDVIDALPLAARPER